MAWPTKTDFVDGDVLTAAQVNNIGTNLNVFNPTSATNGQVWIANGSGSGSYQTPAGGVTVISSGNLSTTELDLTSIPATYKELELHLTNVTTSAGERIELQFNGQANSYANPGFIDQAFSAAPNSAGAIIGRTSTSGTTARFSTVVRLPNYATSCFQYGWVYRVGVNGTVEVRYFVHYNSQFIINRLRAYTTGGTFTAGTYELRGIK